jgi:hypothetical protein
MIKLIAILLLGQHGSLVTEDPPSFTLRATGGDHRTHRTLRKSGRATKINSKAPFKIKKNGDPKVAVISLLSATN